MGKLISQHFLKHSPYPQFSLSLKSKALVGEIPENNFLLCRTIDPKQYKV